MNDKNDRERAGTPQDGRAREIVDAYGADPARWPGDERAWMENRARTDAALSAQLDSAAVLDRYLDRIATVAVSSGLQQRILQDFDRVDAARRTTLAAQLRRAVRLLSDVVWPDAPLWKPFCALALSLAIGCAAGLVSQDIVPRENPEQGVVVALDNTSAPILELTSDE